MSQPQFYKNLYSSCREHWFTNPSVPKITKKQFEILDLLYNFRFLNRIQIQTLMEHKNHKRILEWLGDLTEKQFIERIYSNKILLNTKPAVYFLSKNGRKILKDSYEEDYSLEEIKNTYRDNQRSEVYRLQKLLIADCYIAMAHYYNDKENFELHFMTPGDVDYRENDHMHKLRPDAFALVINQDEKEVEDFHINFFIIHERTPKFFIRARMRHIVDHMLDTILEQDEHQFFVIIATKSRIKNFAKKVLNAKLERHTHMGLYRHMTVGFTTIDEFKTQVLEDIAWNDLPYFQKIDGEDCEE